MYFIGIDPSLTNTGIVVLDGCGKLVAFYNIKPKTTGDERLSFIKKEMEKLLNGYCHNTIWGIEDYAYGVRNSRALTGLGELGGVIRLLFFEYFTDRTPLTRYSPTSIKKFVTGKGNAKKELMLKAVFKEYGFDTDDHNLSDAYAIAKLRFAHYIVENYPSKLPNYKKYQQEVLKKIIKEKK